MGKRDDWIAKYAEDLKGKCNMTPDMDLLTKVTIGCGPSIYNADASTVAGSQASELETVKNNFLIKKLGLKDGPELMEAITKPVAQSAGFFAFLVQIAGRVWSLCRRFSVSVIAGFQPVKKF